MTEYKPTAGGDDAQRQTHLLLGTIASVGVGLLFGFRVAGLIGALICAPVMVLVFRVVYRVMVIGTANAAANWLVPDARGGVGTTYSHIAALEARGDIAGALTAWEEAIAASPDALAARLNAAELYTRKANNHVRSAELYREVQSHTNSNDEMRRYTSQRLIDLYLGPLNDQGRALVELRKVADRWPGTREAEGARAAIAKIKGV
jgi:tetratricopeptide (TPR) repeat protein